MSSVPVTWPSANDGCCSCAGLRLAQFAAAVAAFRALRAAAHASYRSPCAISASPRPIGPLSSNCQVRRFPATLSPADCCIAGTAWDVAIDSFQVNLGVLVTTGGRLDQSRVDRWSCAGSARGCGCGAFCAACSMCAAAVFRMNGTFSGGSDVNFQMFGGR